MKATKALLQVIKKLTMPTENKSEEPHVCGIAFEAS